MQSRTGFLSGFDKVLLLASALGALALCAALGLFAYLWQNPPRSSVPLTPTEALVFPTLQPSETAPPAEQPSATPAVIPNTPVALPSPLAGFGDNPLPTGKIAYTCFVNQIDQICLMNADGTGKTQLTSLKATSFYASISPRGKKVLFSSKQTGNFEIYSIGIDGRTLEQLTDKIGALYAPEFSPDQRQIIFTNGNSGIWIMQADGTKPRALTTKNDIDPTWSPDGSMIAFASSRAGARQLFVMDADGSNIRQVTNLSDVGGRSSWSPDGKKLAFYAGPLNDHNIYTINIDGTGLTQLTFGGDNLGPSWSPDGNWIAFTSYRDGNNEIYIMRPDGTNLVRLTNNASSDWQPRWGR
jgi:Tol biopolymer transport system component